MKMNSDTQIYNEAKFFNSFKDSLIENSKQAIEDEENKKQDAYKSWIDNENNKAFIKKLMNKIYNESIGNTKFKTSIQNAIKASRENNYREQFVFYESMYYRSDDWCNLKRYFKEEFNINISYRYLDDMRIYIVEYIDVDWSE